MEAWCDATIYSKYLRTFIFLIFLWYSSTQFRDYVWWGVKFWSFCVNRDFHAPSCHPHHPEERITWFCLRSSILSALTPYIWAFLKRFTVFYKNSCIFDRSLKAFNRWWSIKGEIMQVVLLEIVGSLTFWEAPVESKKVVLIRKKEEILWLPDCLHKS